MDSSAITYGQILPYNIRGVAAGSEKQLIEIVAESVELSDFTRYDGLILTDPRFRRLHRRCRGWLMIGSVSLVPVYRLGLPLMDGSDFRRIAHGRRHEYAYALCYSDAEPVSGSFTISLDGAMTFPSITIRMPLMAASIESALEALAGIPADTIDVTYDLEGSDSENANYIITFSGALAVQDIAPITTHFGLLENAEALPFNLSQGRAPVAERQTVMFDSDAAEGSFTLELNYAGSTFTTNTIEFGASLSEVQATVDIAFTIADAQYEVSFWNGSQLVIEFGGALAGQDINDLVVTPAAKWSTQPSK